MVDLQSTYRCLYNHYFHHSVIGSILCQEIPKEENCQVSQYRPASETPFKWRFVGGPLVARNSILSWQGGLLKTAAINVQNIRPVQNCTGLIFSTFLAVVHVIVTWNFYIVYLFGS